MKCLGLLTVEISKGIKTQEGNVEKSRQRRSRPFAVLTYCEYAPRVKRAAALLDRPFGKTQGMLF